ncbi:MAG TPA: F0F1 ATP synthase subunit A [Acidimicrobiales bacterium]|nr:F0F1 ATP synthase subunit A [Acidimicrobiales bacterium]
MVSAGAQVLAIANVPVGEHVTRKIGGLSFNLDTMWCTCIAIAVVVGLGLYMRAKATAGVPSKLQLLWETLVGTVNDQVEASLGPQYGNVGALAVTLFTLILAANWVEILPGVFHNTDYLPAASADVNMTYALGITVVVLANAAAIRRKGLRGYIKGYFAKPVALAPMRIVEELVKPFTLALRLFGNLFAGGIMIALILAFTTTYFAWPVTGIVTVGWKMFDMAIGVIQAFIFALLAILYYEFAVSESH